MPTSATRISTVSIPLHREETDLTASVNNFRWLANLRQHESAMTSSIDPFTEHATLRVLHVESVAHGLSGDRDSESELSDRRAQESARSAC